MLAVFRSLMSLGAFIAIGSLWSLLYVKPGTGEFVIAVTTVAMGVAMVLVATVLARGNLRRVVNKEDQ